MNFWLTLAAATIAGPWDAPVASVQYYDPCCQPVQVYCPCTPVFVQAPIETPQAVAVEKAVADEEVAEAVSARQSVLDPAGLRFKGLNLPDMALDWGLATIGPGTLHPTNYAIASSSGFFPGSGSTGSSASGLERSVITIVQPQTPIVPPGTIIGPGPDKPVVPEPTSVAIWTLLGIGGMGILRRRRRNSM